MTLTVVQKPSRVLAQRLNETTVPTLSKSMPVQSHPGSERNRLHVELYVEQLRGERAMRISVPIDSLSRSRSYLKMDLVAESLPTPSQLRTCFEM